MSNAVANVLLEYIVVSLDGIGDHLVEGAGISAVLSILTVGASVLGWFIVEVARHNFCPLAKW